MAGGSAFASTAGAGELASFAFALATGATGASTTRVGAWAAGSDVPPHAIATDNTVTMDAFRASSLLAMDGTLPHNDSMRCRDRLDAQ
ncbi:hypothetical protein AKJ09_04157 [Labilithrix luteola]|uniref:Uncharacterized protein n=1 Tax=Labilithrix luteola TaxID=1391654 RepID=A0A0K1PVD2_9BACT|nr:hypothetical protein AKJ09_04157 [Labilithrix luteola]